MERGDRITTEYGILSVLLILAVLWDLRTGKIPNLLILSGYGIGLVLKVLNGGFAGVVTFLISALWPVLLLALPFLMRGLGAGDVKLFSVISTFMEPKSLLVLILLSMVVGAGISCSRIILNRDGAERFSLLTVYFRECISQNRILPYSTLTKKSSYLKFCPCILAGYVLLLTGELFK